MNIPPDRIPGTNNLTLKYLYQDADLTPFFNGDFRDQTLLKDRAEDILNKQIVRKPLGEVLAEQNQSMGCGEKTLANIKKIAQGKACAIVTGQQAGVLSGPLYTIYKALTAIKLSEFLNRKHGDYFVPLFWIASDDHDFREINHIDLIGKENDLIKINYDAETHPPKTPVGNIEIGEAVHQLFQNIIDFTNDTEFRDDIASTYAAAYVPGRSFSTAFGTWMTELFKSYGLVMLDPYTPSIKKLGVDLFRKELEGRSESSLRVLARSEKLIENALPVQLNVQKGIFNLFYAEKERHAIHLEEERYLIKDTGQSFSKTQILDAVHKNPEYFSPNVLLRPIFQDTILPTIAYVAGPSEIAYFAQLKPAYDYFGVTMPVIYPRKSITILEKRIARILDKHDLKINDMFTSIDQLIAQQMEAQISPAITSKIELIKHGNESNFNDLRNEIASLDATLESTVDKTLGKILNQTEQLEKKIIQATKKREDLLVRQLRNAAINLYPDGKLQERVLSIAPYLFKYGTEFIDRIYEGIDLTNTDHQIIEL
jgi:bacillithiol biosynthesis cysteine-adding enzyme BshC